MVLGVLWVVYDDFNQDVLDTLLVFVRKHLPAGLIIC